MNARPVAYAPPQPLSLIDQFAELLAEGWQVPDAARELHIPSSYGNALLQRIRKRLGPQAR